MSQPPSSPSRSLTLRVLAGQYAICRIKPGEDMPDIPTDSDEFWSLTQTTDELSLVCPEDHVRDDVRSELGWRVLKLEGVFAFSETGVLSSVLSPLGEAGVGVFAISTFDTDYVLVKAENLAKALAVLTAAGHAIVE